MKLLALAGCALLLASTSACTTANTTAMAPVTNAIAAQIPHCHIGGSLNAGVGGIAGTSSGLTQTFTFDCPAQPYATDAAIQAAAAVTPVLPPAAAAVTPK